MKITPVSGDLLTKIALGAAALYALYYFAQQAKSGASSALDAASAWASNVASTKLNPASDQNIVYAPITSAVTAATGQDNSLGTWLASVFNGGDAAVATMLSTPPSTGGATGTW